MRRPELIALSTIALVLVLIPLPWHWKARNIATLSTIFWIAGDNLIHLVNASLWAGNVIDKAPVWCDITTKFFLGGWIGIPCAALCLVYHLEAVASTRFVTRNHHDRRRRLIGELILCVGIPIFIMCIHPLVQGHRFDIMEDFGCQFNLYWSWPALLVMYIPALAVSVVALVFAVLALKAFLQRRAQFKDVLASSQSGLNASRYLRLMGMAVSVLCCGIAFSVYVIWVEFSYSPLRPYLNWDYVHSNFSRVGQFPWILYPDWYWMSFFRAWLIVPISAYIFFLFFGFGEEAMREYKSWVRAFRVYVLRQDVPPVFVGGENWSTWGPSTQEDVNNPQGVKFPQANSSTHSSSKPAWEDIDLPHIEPASVADVEAYGYGNKKKLQDEEAAIGLHHPAPEAQEQQSSPDSTLPTYEIEETTLPLPSTEATAEQKEKTHRPHPSSDTLTLPPPPSSARPTTRPPRIPRTGTPRASEDVRPSVDATNEA